MEKFDSISRQILDVGITSSVILRECISLVFEKAVDEPNFGTMYTRLCKFFKYKFKTISNTDTYRL